MSYDPSLLACSLRAALGWTLARGPGWHSAGKPAAADIFHSFIVHVKKEVFRIHPVGDSLVSRHRQTSVALSVC